MSCNNRNTPYGVQKQDSIAQGDTYALSFGVTGVSDLSDWECYLQVTNPLTSEIEVSRPVTQFNDNNDRFITTLTTQETTDLSPRDYIVAAQMTNTTTLESGEILMELTITKQWVVVP